MIRFLIENGPKPQESITHPWNPLFIYRGFTGFQPAEGSNIIIMKCHVWISKKSALEGISDH